MATPPAEVADRYLGAELLEGLGREDEAPRWYASIAQRSSRELVFLAPAELRQAAIYEKRGDRAEAAGHYRRFLQAWDGPETALAPAVEWVRARLAKPGA